MNLFCLIVFLGLQAVTASEWGYWGKYGPKTWSELCATGRRQSPINIVTEDAIRIDLGALKFDRYDFAFSGKLINNGHTIQIKLDGIPIHLSGGSLPSVYVLEQMHFHWSAEHTVDGVRDPLELHLVHYNNQYANFSEAMQHEDGIVVVAVLFEVINNSDNQDLMPILETVKLVSNWVGKNTASMRNKLIPLLLLPKDHTTYYRYEGSLTTPGCQESVTWFVMTEKLPISEAQMNMFKHVQSNNGTLKYNYRPTQELGNRKVHHRLEGYNSTSSLYTSNIILVVNIFLVSLLYKNF
ncbi:carbonic anhydrase isoform X2 [Camponotus floridanus]|uniref:carbonic anhydrase isoform X2 n=1 Tax=Camponotus floridanus TaxID=104421 RepID=UPI00059C5FFE|nr:carbonic anhydrase isoform X2 [Camponotus floridanus]